MSNALLVPLIVHSVPAPVSQVQLRENKVVTRRPALALWLLTSGNALFALLAFFIAIYAFRSASTDADQVQLRLGSAGLAAQMFGTETAEQAARDDFDLFHKRDLDDEEDESTSVVEVRNTFQGRAKFVTLSSGRDLVDQQQKQRMFTDVSIQRLLNRRTL